jgi:phosphoribosylformimino-5-aminoimidazole carboxamide ribotide isomerase
MQIIPVIDLKDGIVVHAKQGNRDSYAPLKSQICHSADIFDVINAFWGLFRLPTIYIADLNAITQQSDNADLLADVLAHFPHISFWIDKGYPIGNTRFELSKNCIPVIGSESLNDENVSDISKYDKNFILSLDFSLTGEMGAKTLFSDQDLWPSNIIIMSLPSVGSNLGPDFERLAIFSKHHPKYNIIAAGGIRNNQDLRELEQLGIQQTLVATALHNGNISPDDITNLRTKKYPD